MGDFMRNTVQGCRQCTEGHQQEISLHCLGQDKHMGSFIKKDKAGA